MSQSSQEAQEVITTWFARHPELVNDDHNVAALAEWLKKYDNVYESLGFSDTMLENAYRALAGSGRLRFYASPDTTAQMAKAQQEALELEAQVAAEKAEKDKQAAVERRRLERQARQDASGPGRGSAFSPLSPEETREKQRETQKKQQDAALAQERTIVLNELAKIDLHQVYTTDGTARVMHGRTAEAKKAMRQNLAAQHPHFRDLILSKN